MPSALAFIGGGLLTGIGKGLVETGKAKREAFLKKIEHQRALGRDEKKMKGKAKFERALAEIEQKNRLELEDVKQKDRERLANQAAPSGYQRTEGGLEFAPGGPADPAQVRLLAEAGRGPDGGTTPAQQANNAEIDAARQVLDGMNLDRAEILRRIQRSTDIGRDNPDFDPGLERLVRTATQRKVGKDLKFNLIHRRYLGPPPEFSEPAGPKALPPGVSAEQPDVFDRIGDFFSSGDEAAGPGTPQSRGPRGGGRARGRGGAKAITAMNLSEIDDLINARGDTLSPAELMAIQARLVALGM